MAPRRQSGFTLVELFAAVVILGILAAIAIPKFGNLSEQAETQSCRQNMRNLASALQMYYSSTGNYPHTNEGHRWRKFSAIEEYLGNWEQLECPSCGIHYRYRITGRNYDSFTIRGWNRDCRKNHGMYVNGMPTW